MKPGEFIRARRIKLGHSLRATADALGVGYVFLGEVERGATSGRAYFADLERVLALEPGTLAKLQPPLSPELLLWIECNPDLLAELERLRAEQVCCDLVVERLRGVR